MNENLGSNESATNSTNVNSPVENSTMASPGTKKSMVGIIVPIVVLLVVLAGVGVYYFLNKNSAPNNIYYAIIDNYASSVNKTLDELNILDKPVSIDYDVKMDASSTDYSIKKIANIINKMAFKANLEMDYKKKLTNMNISMSYNNAEAINGTLYLDNHNVYAEAPALYDKKIDLSSDEFNEVLDMYWSAFNKDEYKVIVNELVKIVKNNLKDEYFSKADETISSLGKNVNTTKHTLNMTKENQKEFYTNVINDIANDDKLLTSISNIYKIEKNDIKESLNSMKSEFESDEDVVINIYYNNEAKNIEKIDVNGEKGLIVSKTSEKDYEIRVEGKKVGTATVDKDSYNISVNADGTTLELSGKVENNTLTSLKMKFAFSGSTIELSMNGTKESGTVELNANVTGVKLNAKVDVNIKNIKEVKKADTSNLVKVDSITNDDMTSIQQKLMSNTALLNLINDISNLNSNSYNLGL